MDSKPAHNVETNRTAFVGAALSATIGWTQTAVDFDGGERWSRTDSGPPNMAVLIDWKSLRTKAIESAAVAYAPYSRLRVGAAGLTADGRMLAGCNVENVSYGLTLCAECGVISALHATGGGRLVALACVNDSGTVLMPCGRCRQLLLEHGGPGLLIDHPAGPRRLGDLLPDAFGPDDLGVQPP